MKIALALLLVILAGCCTTPPPGEAQLILKVPKELLERPDPLKTLK